jgi:hypothetical protein
VSLKLPASAGLGSLRPGGLLSGRFVNLAGVDLGLGLLLVLGLLDPLLDLLQGEFSGSSSQLGLLRALLLDDFYKCADDGAGVGLVGSPAPLPSS